MKRIFDFWIYLSNIIKPLGVCANIGILTGSIAGLSLTGLLLLKGTLTLSNTDVVWIALILTGFTWLIALFLLCAMARLTFRSVALPSLVNTILVCFATVIVAKALNAYANAWIIGIVLGFLIGMLLCRLNNLLLRIKK
jgi:MFS-type transporter involved in bile tolerance (Atg22 family)